MNDAFIEIVDRFLPPTLVRKVSLLGFFAAALVELTTIAPGAPLLPQWAWIPVFVGAFPVHLRSVRVFVAVPRGALKVRTMLARVSPSLRYVFVLASIGAALLGVTSLIASRGQPERHGDAYYVRDHAELIRVSRAEYLHEIVLEQRGFASIPLIFYVAAIVLSSLTSEELRSISDRTSTGRRG